ncbi:CgeB family protein [Desulfocurvus sp. DL9XJH121]
MYGGSLPVGRWCVRALASMGHMAEAFEAPAFHPAFTALRDLSVTSERVSQLENGFLQVVSQAILAKVESFEPDLVLALAQAPLSSQALRTLRRDGVATAMWFVEDWRVFTYWKAYAPLYDYFGIIQEDPFFAELEQVGQENALYLPMAADPEFHAPRELTSVERHTFGSDLSFMGAGYPNRRSAFRRLISYDFKIWGTEWDGDPTLERHLQMQGRRMNSEECVKIFNASRINLNLHSSVRGDELVPRGDFVNPRTFELAACGAFQLVDRRDLMDDLFHSDELATFTSMAELTEKIDYFLAHPEEREEYSRRARERVLAEHTYAHRMQALIDFIAARRPGWPAPRRKAVDAMRDFPPELKEQALDLLERLGLPANVGFEDLVQAVRAQSGTLSEVETAILFLDEWRRQYGGK